MSEIYEDSPAPSFNAVMAVNEVPGNIIALKHPPTATLRGPEVEWDAKWAHVTRAKLLGEIAGSFAHELSQPLTAMMNNSLAAQRLLSKSNPDTHTLRQIVGDLVALNRRTKAMIGRLRRLLVNEQVAFKGINFNRLLLEVVELIREETTLKRTKLFKNLAQGLPLILGDRIQLQQVCLNLLLNALEAMQQVPPASRELTLRTFATEDKFVAFEVQDSGPGIPPEKLEAVFEPFVTTKSKGMGMGLSICRTIVSAHHGKISIRNNPGRGATFQVVLPGVVSAGDAV